MADPIIEVVFTTNDGGAVVSITLAGFNAGEPFKSDVTYTATKQDGSVSRTNSSGSGNVGDDGSAVAYAFLPFAGGTLDIRIFTVAAAFSQVVRF